MTLPSSAPDSTHVQDTLVFENLTHALLCTLTNYRWYPVPLVMSPRQEVS